MKARSPHRDSILAFLKEHGPTKVGDLVVALGVERKHVSKVVSRMARSGEIVATDFSASGGRLCQLPDPSTLVNPQPVSNIPLTQSNVRRDQKIPAWNPGVEYDNDGGELRTPPVAVPAPPAAWVEPDEQDIFSHFDMDSSVWRITNLRRSKWQSGSGAWLEAYRATFVKRGGANLAAFTEDELTELLTNYQTPPPDRKFDDAIRLVAIGDTQLGKPDGGGTKATVERFQRIIEDVRSDLEHRDGVQALVLPWLGDCLEGIVSQGGRNVARLDISITEQVRIYRRLFLHQVATLAPYAKNVLIPVVGGNHDEAFRDQVQSPNDSWAIEGASAVADALELADQFSHVKFLFPEPERWGVTVNVASEESPYVIHFEHGHKARNQTKMIDWWKGQTHGRQPAGAADMLITAHWHNFQIQSTGGDRWWMQLPAMDGGSDWFRDKTGEDSTAGVLAMDIVGGQTGWTDLKMYH